MTQIPISLEDVVITAMNNNEETTLTGSFLYYIPRIHKFPARIYDPTDFSSSTIEQYSPQNVTCTFKLYFALFLITKDTWTHQTTYMGPYPFDRYNTPIHLLHNTTH